MSVSHTRTPVEVVEQGGVRRTIVDLSDVLSNATADFEPLRHTIEYMTAEEGAERPFHGLGPEHWPGRAAMAGEIVNLTTHAGTHVDAPYHYGPAVSGVARTIEQVPLSWLFGPGVVLDVRGASRVDGVRAAAVEAELERIGHELRAGDVVLVWTGTNLKEPGYDLKHPGLRRDATEYLVDRGVRLIGIDAWGLDRPFDVMAEEAKAGDTGAALGVARARTVEGVLPDRAARQPRAAPAADRLHRLRVPVPHRRRERRLDARRRDLRGGGVSGGSRGRSRSSRGPGAGSASRSPRGSRARGRASRSTTAALPPAQRRRRRGCGSSAATR